MRSVVLVEPEIPENTGFIARLCKNFDFELRLVKPGFNLSECRKTAQNCQDILRDAVIYDDLHSAIEDLDFVVGTKPGKVAGSREFVFRDNTSIMLGRESSGLKNSELERCDATVSIETLDYSSLNLSHAAGILMYEASFSEGQNTDSDRLNFIEREIGLNTRKILERASPTDSELDKVIEEFSQS